MPQYKFMIDSHIGWTDNTFNPVEVVGGGFYCVKVSPACKFCYAERVNKRICGFKNVTAYDYKVMDAPPPLHLREDILAKWARMKTPKKNFVTSMSDMFGEFVPEEWTFKIIDAAVAAPLQVFQFLTKRSKLMKERVNKYCQLRGINVLPSNIWLMVSVEDQDNVKRVADLIATKCQVRGLSVEPLLGPVNLCLEQTLEIAFKDAPPETRFDKPIYYIDWIIVGGESGQKARIMKPSWAYSIQRQCKMYDKAFFFKQWGEWVGGRMDIDKGKVLVEDGGIFYTNPGHPKIYDWQEQWEQNNYYRLVSARVGRNPRELSADTMSDNAMFGGKHCFEFPVVKLPSGVQCTKDGALIGPFFREGVQYVKGKAI